MVDEMGANAVERIVAKLAPQFTNVPAFLYAPLLSFVRTNFSTPPATLRSRLEQLSTSNNGEVSTSVVWLAVLLSLGDGDAA